MLPTLEEAYGKQLLSHIFTHIWLGDWDKYEETMQQLPDQLALEFPFHKHYDRESTALWRDNYFSIPGDYFIPPYLSTYQDKSEEDDQEAKQSLLCLIGAFDRIGFYYPLEKEEFPDHIGSITAFIAAATNEEVKAIQANDEELLQQLQNVQHEMYQDHLAPALQALWKTNHQKLSDPFFQAFLPYYMDQMEALVQVPTT
ncbi:MULTISPECIES: molecular chaperone TorD family protein [unclassified Virgibacillus]|uniref:molecular chaperone TorD family protein n=1 Tax=unclassified Virgibacillus TaxID=2620237 RepID=UPI0024DE33E3|nr:molecular chaperone TorD family protein [Virgibacillus sp. LDC-1]